MFAVQRRTLPCPLQFRITVPAPLAPADCPGFKFPEKPGALIKQLGAGCGRGISLVALMHFIVAGPEIGAVP